MCSTIHQAIATRHSPADSSVVSGYAGGNDNPTYQDHGRYDETGHYEAVLVIHDPELATFASLLEYFWRNIDPTDGAGHGTHSRRADEAQ